MTRPLLKVQDDVLIPLTDSELDLLGVMDGGDVLVSVQLDRIILSRPPSPQEPTESDVEKTLERPWNLSEPDEL